MKWSSHREYLEDKWKICHLCTILSAISSLKFTYKMSDPLEELEEAHYKHGVVIGLTAVAGTVPRQDVDKLLHDDPEVFNLFLLALSELQAADMTKERMGYFQIPGQSFAALILGPFYSHSHTGIHGLPRALWDGIGGKSGIKVGFSGYCAHGTPRFPTWHRPYLAMLEVRTLRPGYCLSTEMHNSKACSSKLSA